MSRFIEDLIMDGFRNISSESYSSHEESGGFQTEYTENTFVAEKGDGGFFRITVSEKREFGPRGGFSRDVDTKPISEDDYRRVAENNQNLDTEEVRATIAESKKKDEERKGAKKRLRDSLPICPEHKLKMRLKKGAYGAFLGCPKYPQCKNTAQLSSEQRRLVEESEPKG